MAFKRYIQWALLSAKCKADYSPTTQSQVIFQSGCRQKAALQKLILLLQGGLFACPLPTSGCSVCPLLAQLKQHLTIVSLF